MGEQGTRKIGSLEIEHDRVVQEVGSIYKVALLVDVDGVHIGYSDRPAYKTLAIVTVPVVALFSVYVTPNQIGINLGIAAVVAAVFYYAYLKSRRAMVRVHAGVLELQTNIKGQAFEKGKDFAWTVTSEKRRLLHGRPRRTGRAVEDERDQGDGLGDREPASSEAPEQ